MVKHPEKSVELTVLMPVYNAGHFLSEAIESILSQTFTNFELLIINDGSTDNSKEIITSFKDPRIRFVENEKNLGLIATLNKGVDLATASIIARMDQDDSAYPERLAKQYELLKKSPHLLAIGTAMHLISVTGKKIGYLPVLVGSETLRRALAVTNPFAHPSMMFRREAVLAVGGYSKDAYTGEDYELWVRLAGSGDLSNLNEPLLRYRLNPRGMSISLRGKQKQHAAQVGERQWERYGAAGPAPRKDWEKIWPYAERAHMTKEERLLYSTLHLNFAKGYRKRGKWGMAFQHLLASFQWSLANRGSYIALLMFVMPFSLFYQLEERLAILLNNSRAGQTA